MMIKDKYLVTDAQHAASSIARWFTDDPENNKFVGLDIETTGLNPYEKAIRLVQLSTGDGAFLIDVFDTPDLEPLRNILESGPVKVLHNAKFDVKFLLLHYDIKVAPVFDTMIAYQMLYGPHGAGLKNVVAHLLEEDVAKGEQTSNWGAKKLSEEQIEYAAKDAELLPKLAKELWSRLDLREREAARIEFRAVLPIASLEANGIKVDLDKAKKLRKEMVEHREQAALDFEALLPEEDGPDQGELDLGLPERSNLNMNSHKQVKEALAKMGLEVHSTAEGVISKIDHPAAKALMVHRKYSKSISSFLDTYPVHTSKITGRIHANFKQVHVVTGRMSCTNPNLQQTPKDQRFRDLFVAEDGNLIITTDYSQIELRILAELSGDRNLYEIFNRGEDLHKATAAAMLGVPLEEVSSDQRHFGKGLNFGLVYGQGPKALGGTLGVSKEKAKSLIDAYFHQFPKVKSWIWKQKNKGKDKSTVGVRTMSGRMARLPLENDNGERERDAVNYPIQGTSADITKEALYRLYKALPEEAMLVNVVHDEVVVEAPEDGIHEIVEIVEREMIAAGEKFLKRIPVEVESEVAKEWKK